MRTSEQRTLPELFSDLISHMTSLFRAEARLARAEVSENLSRAGAGIGLIGAGAVLVMPALVILLDAAVSTLVARGLQPHLSALIVGGGTLLIGLIFAWIGLKWLKPRNLVPNRTWEQLQQDADVARKQVA